jgi:hypothetical protein
MLVIINFIFKLDKDKALGNSIMGPNPRYDGQREQHAILQTSPKESASTHGLSHVRRLSIAVPAMARLVELLHRIMVVGDRRLVGHNMAAVASRRSVAVRCTTARPAVLPSLSLGDAGFELSQFA